MNSTFKKLLILGLSAEIIIFLLSYVLQASIEDTFRYAARYSGRLSAVLFIYTFYLFARAYPKPVKDHIQLRNYIQLFAILHLVHFGFLAMSVYLNAIPLETVKVIGGALAYSMIIIAPFKLHQLKSIFHLIFFYYVSLVMMLTYVARVKGDFDGAAPSWEHYIGLGTFISCSILFAWWIRTSTKK